MIDDDIEEYELSRYYIEKLVWSLIDQLRYDDIVVIEYGNKEYTLDISNNFIEREEAEKK